MGKRAAGSSGVAFQPLPPSPLFLRECRPGERGAEDGRKREFKKTRTATTTATSRNKKKLLKRKNHGCAPAL